MATRTRTFAGAKAGATIPRYFLYGDDDQVGGWFVNIEPLAKRCKESNWYIAPHSHPNFMQIMLVRKGRGTMHADGGEFTFDSPSVLIVPTQTVHSFRYDIDTDGWVLTLSESYFTQLLGRAPDLEALAQGAAIIDLSDAPAAVNTVNDAMLKLDEELDQTALGGVIAAEGWLIGILVTLLRLRVTQKQVAATAPRGHAGIVKQFKELVEKRYREGWPLSRFADELNITVSALRVACTSVAGQTPNALIHDRLIVEARRSLVYTDMTVSQIAYWLGFEDPSYFSRFFTKQTGERPAAFRQKQKFGNEAV